MAFDPHISYNANALFSKPRTPLCMLQARPTPGIIPTSTRPASPSPPRRLSCPVVSCRPENPDS